MPIFDRTVGALGAFRRAIGVDPTFADQTDILKNKKGQFIQFVHVPTGAKVDFKAFLTSFGDSYQSQWTGEPSYGKMDNIQTFQSTTRAINIGFSVPAASIDESISNLEKISTLINMLYPVFEGAENESQTIKSAPLIKDKFMNWIQNSADGAGLLGKMDGVTYSPNLEVGVFQLDGNIYPKRYDVTINYTVIHEERLGWTKESADIGGGETLSAYSPQNVNFPYGAYVGGGTITKEQQKPNLRKSPNQKNLDNVEKSNKGKLTR
jgi:hypothetical protein